MHGKGGTAGFEQLANSIHPLDQDTQPIEVSDAWAKSCYISRNSALLAQSCCLWIATYMSPPRQHIKGDGYPPLVDMQILH